MAKPNIDFGNLTAEETKEVAREALAESLRCRGDRRDPRSGGRGQHGGSRRATQRQVAPYQGVFYRQRERWHRLDSGTNIVRGSSRRGSGLW